MFTIGTYNDPTKKRGPPKGYIEAIEARLHRMEGLLGGLVKDKDPRAEIVRAELDAMAREAEMTGLKLRRSKAYEEINHAMATSASASASASASSEPASSSKEPTTASGSTIASSSSRPPLHQQPQQLKHHRSSISDNLPLSARPIAQHAGSGYRSHTKTPIHPDTSSTPQGTTGRNQPLLQPSPHPTTSRLNQYQTYEHPRHAQPQQQQPQSHHRPQHTQHSPHGLHHHHSQPTVPVSSSYPKPHHPPQHQQSQHQHQHQSHPQHQQVQPQYSSSYGLAPSPNPGQHSQYLDNRGPLDYTRSSSHPGQSHHQGSPLLERNHNRTNSGHSGSNGSNGNLNTSHQHSVVANGGNYSAESHSIVTHRPSLNAHQLSNPLTGYMSMPENLSKEETLIMPSMDVMDHLLDIHFRFVHPVLPMLHFKTITDQVHSNAPPPSHLLFAIIGLASRFSDDSSFRNPQPGLERPPSTIFYERAKYFIKDEYDNSQIPTIQALLLMAVQQMGFCESQRAWLYVGMAIRMAQDLGLNKEPSDHEQSRNRLQCELRKRTWWSIYVVERLVCAGLGRPLTITQKDCETGFPQFEDDDREWPLERGLAVRSTLISNFVHLIMLSKMQGNILDYIKAKFTPPTTINNNPSHTRSPCIGLDLDHECHVDTSAGTFAMLDKSLSEWRQNLPEVLQDPTPQSPHFGLFLHLTYNSLVILLHRPEMTTSQTSASLCTQAAESITDIIEILMSAKALTSMFISCLYAIFSAGVVHFMNIPSVKKTEATAISSPTLSASRGTEDSNHAMNAKANLKRCIDALKFLASHWVSAGRRAKVLEDLLDLKHVSLKDLEVDTFRTSPLGPSWALESHYKESLVTPREGQDRLRQQCRSKAMAIHSLLANDEDFKKMQQRRNSNFDVFDMDHPMESTEDSERMAPAEKAKSEPQEGSNLDLTKHKSDEPSKDVSPANSRAPIGLGVQSPQSPIVSVSSPASIRTENSTGLQQSQETDHAILLSTASLGLDSPAGNTRKDAADIKDENNPSSTQDHAHRESGLLTPMTMTTLVQRSASPRLGTADSMTEGLNGRELTSVSVRKQGTMLDPFSVPSSISFPDWDNDRRPSHGGSNGSGSQSGSQLNTIWLTDSVTHRTTARSAASSPMTPSTGSKLAEDSLGNQAAKSSPAGTSTTFQRLYEAGAQKKDGNEDNDLVWNDMPPTLGLDEWTAYIGAMMMRWLYASGHSSPRSTASS
ncbi:hypothetical protein BG011_009635 [Mortierella polycephala]|uniref:Xylanolytic transcriptional activator regulatory domain-containing protein n=1 Tax=Mortierella polycephala TaxID=41804 RepID=A0A9P6PMQ8_9FUNG|nr:hypothetical protein BG011_009635 [Mortierella polycephala]